MPILDKSQLRRLHRLAHPHVGVAPRPEPFAAAHVFVAHIQAAGQRLAPSAITSLR